jgi:hypothetical protein
MRGALRKNLGDLLGALVRCRCGHGIGDHFGDGCGAGDCGCQIQRETLIDNEYRDLANDLQKRTFS